jgi:hypothetical protein
MGGAIGALAVAVVSRLSQRQRQRLLLDVAVTWWMLEASEDHDILAASMEMHA